MGVTVLGIQHRSLSARRAWIEIIHTARKGSDNKSLSARRAWIEITLEEVETYEEQVALRKESVDRNNDTSQKKKINPASLSARRAWIEIVKLFRQNYECFVALRKESVDRNSMLTSLCCGCSGRSPQGERG